MQKVAYLLNRIIGPFFTGILVAAVASASDPVLIMPLLLLAGSFAYLSFPGSDRRLEQVLDRLGEHLEIGVD
jgi:hypothetical protein